MTDSSQELPEQAERLNDLAVGELANGRPAAALRILKRALALNPGLTAAYLNLGMALADLGRADEAERAYWDALRIDSAHPAAHHRLGELLRHRGELEDARRSFASALAANPSLNESRLGLGDVLVELGELQAAASCYREAIARGATAAAEGRLGNALWRLGDVTGAREAFERVIAGGSSSPEAHYNLGSVRFELGEFADAVASAREALRLNPGFTEATTLCAAGLVAMQGIEAAEPLPAALGGSPAQRHLTVAIRLMSSRWFDPARQCLQRVLEEEPDAVMARHLLAALSGSNPEHPVDGYVRQVFDASAATFDRELVAKLGYAIPREMVEALRAVESTEDNPWDVLDLGCGTGLVGMAIAPYSRRLVGVDLAPNMIERAGARHLYTDLYCAELMTALAQEGAREVFYDIVTAADVFIYVGKLDAVIPAVRRVLRPGGLFALSAEAVEVVTGAGPEDYRL
ncbi:MAG TPA: tetratricopeptide repeat protein, partial [Steroidobacteraceae bacterium]|nr:tetratricopeptide repeat protein [Steroidobacteraceae bacterium]